MEDIWFEPDVTQQDVEAFSRALALQDKPPAPFLAMTGHDTGAARLIMASTALFGLFGVDNAGALQGRLLQGSDPGARRFSLLAQTLTLEGAPRLERLRFFLGPGSEIVTFLCRRTTLRGQPVFLAAALGVRPGLIPARSTTRQATLPAAALLETPPTETLPAAVPLSTILEPVSGVSTTHAIAPLAAEPAVAHPEASTLADLQAGLRARWPDTRTLRFLWQTDAAAICTAMSPQLGDVVGHGTADLVGRDLLDLAPQLDPTGTLAKHLARHETFSGLDLRWPMADQSARIAVTAGASPSFDTSKNFTGFRGFGVIHLDRLEAATPVHFARPQTEPSEAAHSPVHTLSSDERSAFALIGDALRAHDLTPSPQAITPAVAIHQAATQPVEPDAAPIDRRLDPPSNHPRLSDPTTVESPHAPAVSAGTRDQDISRNGLTILDRLSLGLLVSRNNVPIFANRHLLDTLGFADEDALHEAGGMTHLFGGLPGNASGSEAVGVRGKSGTIVSANARMQAIEWDGLPATLLTLRPNGDPAKAEVVTPPLSEPKSLSGERRLLSDKRLLDDKRISADKRASDETRPLDEKRPQEERRQRDDEVRELRAILETATDGVAVLDDTFTVLSLNRSGEALFGCDRSEVTGKPFLTLFAPHNQSLAAEYCEGLKSNATKSLLNDGREILVRAHKGGTIPVFMTLGRLGPSALASATGETPDGARYCALFRDLTHWKKVEKELDHARTEAERTSALKSDFLAKVSHEIRTPLNAIIGFAEVIMDERFGPVGNPRYKEYLRDIHASGTHVMSLVNDLLDLSKIEAGKMELNTVAVDANKIITECVSIMQPQASRERVIMRLSLGATVPHIRADERSLRQIVLNLLSNAVKFNEPGGQVIVATALTDAGQVVIRIRDTGPGMSDKDIETALEPFRQLSTSRPMTAGTGLGLPLTKALVEANHASFNIRSKVDQGTLVEVAFAPAEALVR